MYYAGPLFITVHQIIFYVQNSCLTQQYFGHSPRIVYYIEEAYILGILHIILALVHDLCSQRS